MKRIWTVARREIKALFDQPVGYVLLIVFIVINDFLFFRQAYVTGAATLRPMLDLLPWLFLFFIPAVAMRALAEDIRSGQVEVVLAQPLTELELVLGKYLGVILVIWLALGLTLPIPLGLQLGADLTWGSVLAQYVGAGLLAAGLAAIGVWGSSITRSQITAFIVSVAVMFALVLIGLDPLVVGLPPILGAVAARIGVLSHFESIGRGVIDLRDVIYFLSLAGVFLALAYGAIMARKLAPAGGQLRRLRAGTAVLVTTLVVVNLAGSYIGGRLDLTPGRAYTLSKATKDLAGNLDDLVTVKVFASKELPAEVALMKRDVDDVLHDLRAAGHGKIKLIERDPAEDEAAARDARSLGIQPVQFNVVGRAELQVKQGYFGLAVQYAGGEEAIPVIRQTDDLEYRLASAIRTLTRTQKPLVALVEAQPSQNSSYQALQQELGKSYQVRPATLSDSTVPWNDVVTLVLIGAPDSVPQKDLDRVTALLDRGASVLILASGMSLSPQSPVAMSKPVGWNPLLKRFGLSIRSDMVYDLLANQIVPLRTELGQVYGPYPLWLRAQSAKNSVVNQELEEVFLPWASSIDTAGAPAGVVTPLLLSSRAGGVVTGQTSIDPRNQFSQTDLSTRLLAVLAAAPPAAKDSTGAVRGRVVVVGTPELAVDRYVQGSPENLVFTLNAIDWLAQDEAFISIRSKDRRPPTLVFGTPAARDLVKYANVVLLPALIALGGILRLLGRRRKTREPYRPLAPATSEAS